MNRAASSKTAASNADNDDSNNDDNDKKSRKKSPSFLNIHSFGRSTNQNSKQPPQQQHQMHTLAPVPDTKLTRRPSIFDYVDLVAESEHEHSGEMSPDHLSGDSSFAAFSTSVTNLSSDINNNTNSMRALPSTPIPLLQVTFASKPELDVHNGKLKKNKLMKV